MNGIQNIIDRILADAAAECAAVTADADARCEELRAHYKEAEESEYAKVLSAGARDAEQRVERRGSVAVLEAKKQVLATKQEMVLAAFERAAQLLSELPEDRYVPLLARLSADASRTGAEELAFSARDASRIGQAVCDAANELLRRAGKTANLTVSADARKIRGGVVVINGDIETNCSVDTLVSQYKNELSGRVAATLLN